MSVGPSFVLSESHDRVNCSAMVVSVHSASKSTLDCLFDTQTRLDVDAALFSRPKNM